MTMDDVDVVKWAMCGAAWVMLGGIVTLFVLVCRWLYRAGSKT
jgi:hypothetical protein